MQAILATLGYVLSPDGSRVLIIRRDTHPDDLHFGYYNGLGGYYNGLGGKYNGLGGKYNGLGGKYNGLGGKLEPGEDVVAGMRREIREEAGIECEALELAGTISWPGFGRNGENWFGFLFRITRWSGTPYETCPEGTLIWTEVANVLAGTVPVRPPTRTSYPWSSRNPRKPSTPPTPPVDLAVVVPHKGHESDF
ncbi:NUDIX domain-containing protein [Micromonospora sp. NPDC049523]|uniref:NUDIX hydrolase n=1 Tax=Micromonospora sp. NPDC049523 TaxID=3155921 RepID=UPI00343C24AF